MPDYVFHLHDGPTIPKRAEVVQARDDSEARDLASLRLTLSQSFTQVEVERNGREVFRLKRDSQKPRLNGDSTASERMNQPEN